MTSSSFSFSKLSESLHYDFCPWLNSYVYWLKKPIGWVIGAFLSSLLLGICVSPQAFLAAAAIASIGVIGCLWPWIAILGLRGQLSWSQVRCEEGDCIETTLSLSNRWPWPVWGLIIEADDAISSQVNSTDRTLCLSRASAMALSSFAWKCKPEARGVYPKKPIQLATAFPFGIWTCRRVLKVPTQLIVWPRIVKLSDVPERSGANHSPVGGSSSQAGNEGDWMGVRSFRPGDSLRQVHWAQTARRDSLVVFERQTRSRQGVSLWLDPGSASLCGPEQCEWLIRILASVSRHFSKHHWDVRAAVNGDWMNVHPNQASQTNWFDRLASWTPAEISDSQVFVAAKQNDSKMMVICIASRVAELFHQFQNSASDVQWIVLNTSSKLTTTNLSAIGSRLQIDDCGNHAGQLQHGWNQSCQRNYQLS